MPFYYFDIDDGHELTRDDTGVEFADLQAARDAAISILPEVAREILPDGDMREIVSTLRDESGRNVFRATLSLQTVWLVDPPSKN